MVKLLSSPKWTDTSLAHISSKSLSLTSVISREGKVEQILQDHELNKLNLEKAAVEATWSEKMYGKPITIPKDRSAEPKYVIAPALPSVGAQPMDAKTEMQDFLDGLPG